MKLKIYLDTSGKTFGFNIIDNNQKVVYTGDGYETPDDIIIDLQTLAINIIESLQDGNVEYPE